MYRRNKANKYIDSYEHGSDGEKTSSMSMIMNHFRTFATSCKVASNPIIIFVRYKASLVSLGTS